MEYFIKARDEQGTLLRGVVEARDREELIRKVLQRGYHLVHIQTNSPFHSLALAARLSGKRELIIYCRQLAVMQRAGITINRSLQVLIDQAAKPAWKETLQVIKRDVEKGFSLAEAAAYHKAMFPPVVISMIQAGEMGGILPDALERSSEYLETSQEIRSRMLKAIAYPLFILVLTLLVMMLVGVLILPAFTDLYASAQAVLPLPTRIMLGLTGRATAHGALLAVGIMGIVIAAAAWAGTASGRRRLHGLLLQAPLVGRVVTRGASLQLAGMTAALLAAGVPLLAALEVVEKATGNIVIKDIFSEAREQIKEGLSVSQALQKSQCFDPMLIQMIAAGEESSSLNYMFDVAASYLKKEIFWTMDKAMAVVEPLLILLAALVVGAVVIATLLPVFDLVNLDPARLM